MPESRTVILDMDATAQTKIIEATSRKEFYNAIGYLSTWNLTFPKVTIRAVDCDDGELIAIYETEEGKTGYVIGAVWHNDHYGFHS